MSREGLVGEKIFGACLGHSDNEIIEVLMLAKLPPWASRLQTFVFFGALVWRVPWEAVLKSKSSGRLCAPQKGTLKGAGASFPEC